LLAGFFSIVEANDDKIFKFAPLLAQNYDI